MIKVLKHGVGRIDIVENRLVGMKSRGCYETPGGTIIMEALRAVEQLVLDKTSFEFREELGVKAAQLVYDGRWFTPLCKSVLAAADELSTRCEWRSSDQTLQRPSNRNAKTFRQQLVQRRVRNLWC